MYVSLEPCTHYGLTPPCTNIIKKKIKNVYYTFNDPDHRTNKKAKIQLDKYKIKSKKINLDNSNFYQSYFLNIKHQIPYIDAKIAFSKDNLTINKKNEWITNSRSRKVGHLLRSRYDCIISTSKTINKDNSLLNCRIDGLDNYKPDLIIIDRNFKLKKFKNAQNYKKRNTFIVTVKNDLKKISYFKRKKIKIIKINKLEDKGRFFKLLYKIYKKEKEEF